MATLQSTGIGSGLDVNGIVTKLVTAERQPKQSQIVKQQADVGAKISAMGQLKGALAGFQAALSSLKSVDTFAGRTATSGDEKIFTASASATATPSSYDINVDTLAKAQQLSSTAFGASDAIGTGLLKIAIGTDSFTINVQSSGNTLAAIRDQINGASDNVGVKAAIVQAEDGSHLVLTSTKTGAANQIKITTSEGDGGLGQLTYDSAGNDTSHYLQIKPAQDSVIYVAGYKHTSSSNTVSDAIDGVTLNLLKESGGEEVTVDVKLDMQSTKDRITNFVNQLNSVVNTINSLESYDPATKKAGPLLGDALLRGIETSLRNALVSPVEGANDVHNTLASLGIKTAKNGSLTVDSEKLQKALDSDFQGVAKFFGSETGLATRLDTLVSAKLADTGEIAARNKILDARTKALQQDAAALDARMALVQDRYLKQFNALDTMLSNMQQTSQYLTQQLASLPKIG